MKRGICKSIRCYRLKVEDLLCDAPSRSEAWLFFSKHTYTICKSQALLISTVFQWVCKCDPTAWNELHWYSVTIQSVTIFDLQVKNIDFRFSSKSGASGIFCLKTLLLMVKCDVLWQFLAFQIVTAVILLCGKWIFSAQFVRMELSSVARLIYQ